MPTLRKRVRQALSAREPSAEEAASELDAILARAAAPRRARFLAYAGGLASVAALALAGWLVLRPPPAQPHGTAASGPLRAGAGVHLYVHVAGEPESQAVALDLTALTAKGDRP
jgi:hypothetical protein